MTGWQRFLRDSVRASRPTSSKTPTNAVRISVYYAPRRTIPWLDCTLAGRSIWRSSVQVEYGNATGRTLQLVPCADIDPTKEPVDGKGPPPAPFTDKQRKACIALREAAVMLGYEGDRITRAILGERATLREVSIRHRPLEAIHRVEISGVLWKRWPGCGCWYDIHTTG